ncbi:hypothetical protein KFZ70_15170 [Tamlana fucoidanivorans]|uniref:Uncharacterized protein n=1 Tax=Allotamlana fucoidanivorans TaxID=2583814 RepID=A0A5C4SBD5_9FLAO|nr:hypothetical protein [Tamlana fucoidanivorans]TNJ40841.1 hypothetical protein FGF67_16775 [Tamlana fucoidanivorans]
MNRITKTITLLLIFLCISCNQKKSDNTYLANYINSVKVDNSLTENPLLVIDGYAVEYETMNDGWFLLLEEDISKVEYLKKENTVNIYGEKGKNGVVLLTTKLKEREIANTKSDKKTLYVLDGEIISVDEYKKIDQSKIIGIGTITEPSAIKEFTSDNYDELIYISTKMPTE